RLPISSITPPRVICGVRFCAPGKVVSFQPARWPPSGPKRAEPVVKGEDQGLAGDHGERKPGNENEANQGEPNDKREARPGLGFGVVVIPLPVWLAALAHAIARP